MTKKKAERYSIGDAGSYCFHTGDNREAIPKLCIFRQECWHCAFDQWLGDMEESRCDVMDHATELIILAKAA